MGTERVVWLLGSGFSKPLGGPLLRDLFRQQDEEEVVPHFPDKEYPDLARSLPWVQKCFQLGKYRDGDGSRGLWADAEEFLAYVDDAYGGSGVTPALKVLQALIEKAGPGREANKWQNSDPYRHSRHMTFINRMPGVFGREMKRALAAECHHFLMSQNPRASERWLPYREWVKGLQPGVDTVITFNYDLVIETAAQQVKGVENRLNVVHPMTDSADSNPTPDPNAPPLARVPILKLHGSVDWKNSSGQILAANRADILKDPDLEIAIASPGANKEELAGSHFKPLWTMAEKALTVATRLVIVGYSFPLSDPAAQYRLLNAFTGGNTQQRQREVHLVLGPDTDTRRMLSLLRSTAPTEGSLSVANFVPRNVPESSRLLIVQHPLGAQDFIGRHIGFTEPRREFRV